MYGVQNNFKLIRAELYDEFWFTCCDVRWSVLCGKEF